jgi:hypothetical protein
MIDINKLLSAGATLPQLMVSRDKWLSGYLAAIDTASCQSGFNLPRWEDASRADAIPVVPSHPVAMAIPEYYFSVSALSPGKTIRS